MTTNILDAITKKEFFALEGLTGNYAGLKSKPKKEIAEAFFASDGIHKNLQIVQKFLEQKGVQCTQEARIDLMQSLSLGDLEKGQFHHMLGDDDIAIKYYLKAIDIGNQETQAIAHHSLGMLYVNQERYEEAEEQFMKLITLEDEDIKAQGHTFLGVIYFHQKKYKESEEEFKRAIELGNLRRKLIANLHLRLLYQKLSAIDPEKNQH